jgi:Tfp pilus assembly protein PilE
MILPNLLSALILHNILPMSERGFTFIKLILATVLIAILMTVSIPKYTDLKSQSQNADANSKELASRTSTH